MTDFESPLDDSAEWVTNIPNDEMVEETVVQIERPTDLVPTSDFAV